MSPPVNDWFAKIPEDIGYHDDRMYRFDIHDLEIDTEHPRISVEISVNVDGFHTIKYFEFDTFEQMEEFIKTHEPRTFMYDLNGNRPNFKGNREDRYQQWLGLMKKKGLKSAIQEYHDNNEDLAKLADLISKANS